MVYKEPSDYDEAINSNDSLKWQKAISDEISSLESNNTWSITDLPADRWPISARWIFKRKCYPDGSLDKYKARLVARGFSQRFGIDFFETYASVNRHESIRLFFVLCIQFDLVYKQFDVITAFLNGVFEETVYLLPPKGTNCPTNKVLKLHKSIYGLRQSPRCWQQKLNSILMKIGLKATYSDPSFYVGNYRGSKVIMIMYVDDGIAASADEKALHDLLHEIEDEIKIKQIDSNYFVGFEVSYLSDSGILLHQTNYITTLLKQYELSDCKPTTTPLNDIEDLFIDEEKDTNKSLAPYRELIGALNYISCLTRPDITFSVNLLAQFNNSHKKKHWTAAKMILRYLQGTKSFGLKITKTDTDLITNCYSDSDWGGDPVTRRSTSGVIIDTCGTPIIYRSKQQSIIASSSTESEFIASNQTTKELM